MAVTDARQHTTWGTRLRFLVRLGGLSGALALAAGVALASSAFPAANQWTVETFRGAADGQFGRFPKVAALTLVAGAAAVVLALAIEVLGLVFGAAGRHTAATTSTTIGGAAVVVLLIVINVYSFTHHARYDFTRNRQFTLAGDLTARLRTLRSEQPTTIVVLQKHRIFGSLSDDRDSYTKAAEEKVTEKVKDLVDLFRELGPRFHVAVLDTEAFGYNKQLENLTKEAPELKSAIEAAPENSIFFHANKRVQRLAFNEFLQLDKTASREANDGRGNLVLLPQGVENFARRVLAVQERKPKVAVCVVHEWLSTTDTTGQAEYSLGGLKRTLADHGFEVIDIILKKNWEDSSRELEPAAYTVHESKLERLEGELDSAQDEFRAAQLDVKLVATRRAAFEALANKPFRVRVEFLVDLSREAQFRGWSEIGKSFRDWIGEDSRPITEDSEPDLRATLAAGLTRQGARADQEVRDADKVRAEAEEKVKAAQQDERTIQDRRVSDVKAKFAGLLADVDLLIIPRYTLVNATIGRRLDPSLHTLSKPQIEVVRDFMKAGKPVLACLGSLNGPNGLSRDGTDDLDKLIADRGIELGRDTILYDPEAKAFAAIKAGRQLGGSASDIPPLVFAEQAPDAERAKPNPVGAALRLTGRSVDQKLDLRLHAPRPVYLARGWQDRVGYAAEFVFSSPDSWNEERPFLSTDRVGRVSYTPRYEATLDNDPKWETRMAERRGPFPLGVAVESKVPASWMNEAYEREQLVAAALTPIDGLFAAGLTASASKLDRPTQRLIVFGSGNMFAGSKLEPAQQKLLLHSVNWLTGRDDRLPRAGEPAWSFPRVELSDRELLLWRYGTAIGLPLVAVYLGVMVTMFRRLR